MTPDFEHTCTPAEFTVGEFIDNNGETGILLGFREEGHDRWTGYGLHPMTAVVIVQTLADWLDAHAGPSPEA